MSLDIDVAAELAKEENFDILAELTDPTFIGRKHYNKRAYSDGCRGPLCRKRERDLSRRARQLAAAHEGRPYYAGRTPRHEERDTLLEAVIEWHLEHLSSYHERRRRERDAEKLKQQVEAYQRKMHNKVLELKELSA